jgi:hypothetical protein
MTHTQKLKSRPSQALPEQIAKIYSDTVNKFITKNDFLNFGSLIGSDV